MSELEDLRRAYNKLANRDFTDLVVSERAKGAADMRERVAKLVEPDSAVMASKIRALDTEDQRK